MISRAPVLCDKLISPNQSTCIKWRFILESVVMAHEVIHEIHRTRTSGLVLEFDYKKAYDKVSWEFLVEMLSSRGSGEKWIKQIYNTLFQSSFCVRINGTNGPILLGAKGLNKEILCPPRCSIWWLMFVQNVI